MDSFHSIIIPAHNEQENLPKLLDEIKEVMQKLGLTWEVLVVDDGSTDTTWKTLETIQQKLPELRAIRHTRSFGQTAALYTGIKSALGSIIITMDADGQNNPQDIPRVLQGLANVDCVSGCRALRHDTWQKKVTSKIANACRRLVLGDTIVDTGCSLKAFKACCFQNIKPFRGMHRFLPSLFLIEGYKVREISVSHRPRQKGISHYSLRNRGFSTLSDLLAVAWMKKRHFSVEVERTLP